MTAPYYFHQYIGEFATDVLATARVVTLGWASGGNPRKGMVYFDTTLNVPKTWNGTQWLETGLDPNITSDIVVTETHCHPPMTAVVPRGTYRRASLTMAGNPVNTNNIVIGYTGSTITYTFVNAFGAPGVANVEILLQSTTKLACQKLNDAINGVTDPVNIMYGNGGVGTKPHPDCRSGFTVIRFALGTTQIVANANGSLYLGFKVGDRTATAFPSTLTIGGGWATVNNFTRIFSQRYVMNGNSAAGTPPNDCVAGDYQVFQPMGWVQDDAGNQVAYDPTIVIVEGTSQANTIVVECDLYYSTDEVTFVKTTDGLNITFQGAGGGGSIGSQQFICSNQRYPAGAGLYVRVRSTGTNPADTVDMKVQFHRYPVGV